VTLPAAELLLGEGPRFRSRTRFGLGVGLCWWVKIYRPGREAWAPALVYIARYGASQDNRLERDGAPHAPGDPDLFVPAAGKSRRASSLAKRW